MAVEVNAGYFNNLNSLIELETATRMPAPSGTDNPESMLDELDERINRFIDKFVLPLPWFIFHLPYIAARGVQVRLTRQSEIDAELPALGAEPDDDRTP